MRLQRIASVSKQPSKAKEALALLQTKHPQLIENLNNDKAIDEVLLTALLDELLAVKSLDADALEEGYIAFCHQHQLSGPEQPEVHKAVLGHVKPRDAAERYLTSVGAASSGFSAGRSPRSLLDVLLRADLDTQRRLLHGINMAPYLMWSFWQMRSLKNPYRNFKTSVSNLRRRLGLGHVDEGKELIYWAHCLNNSQQAHIPTVLDSETSPYFRPGGKAKPLKGQGSVPEVVHKPIQGQQLVQPIKMAESS